MQYEIVLSKDVQKFLQKHPEVHERFFSAAEKMSLNPLDPTLDIKSLAGKRDRYRLRI